MSQKNVEILLGKMLTDDRFRNAFLPVGPSSFDLAARFGLEFTPVERSALATLRRRSFEFLAGALDPRLVRSCDSDERRAPGSDRNSGPTGIQA